MLRSDPRKPLRRGARRYHWLMASTASWTLRAAGIGLAALAAFGTCAAAPAVWLVTLMDGEAVVVDGLRRIVAAPGLELGSGALIETGESTALVRLEGPEQSSIDLGPATRVMLSPPAQASRGGRVPVLYLLQGWAKLTSRTSAGSAGLAGFAAPGLDGGPVNGALVLRVAAGEQSLFAETARLDVHERRTGGPVLKLVPGQFYRGDGNKPGSVTPRPDPAWLKDLPRAFRDTIPLRAASFKDRPATPVVLPGPSYEQLAQWLAAEPYVRRDFTQRFAPLLRDPAFRRGVQQRLNAHPEWATVLYPPKDPTR